MFKKTLHFIKYNNAAVFVVLAVFLLGSGVFAATDTGQAFIGQSGTRVEGVDNILLLDADLENFDMDHQIQRIEEDEKYYYVTFTYLDMVVEDGAWQYQLTEKTRKVTKKLKKDIGVWITEELKEEYDARVKELRRAQEKAAESGETQRVEIEEYSGLIGRTLDLAGNLFPAYEPVKVRDLPTPSIPFSVLPEDEAVVDEGTADALTDVYQEFLDRNDPDRDDVFGVLDNCPRHYNPDQGDADEDDVGDVCDPYPNGENETATSTDETPVDEEPVDEPPVDEEPVDEEPVDETSVDETPVDEEPPVEEPESVTVVDLSEEEPTPEPESEPEPEPEPTEPPPAVELIE